MARGIDTKCIHLEEDEGQCSHYGALSYPIYQTATYAHPGVGQSTGFDYSRLQNPTREHLEKMVAVLENGIDAFALCSGMAAISLLMELFRPGDHIIADSDLYGGSVIALTAKNILDKMFQGSLANFAAALYQGKKLNEKEIEELQAFIDRQK